MVQKGVEKVDAHVNEVVSRVPKKRQNSSFLAAQVLRRNMYHGYVQLCFKFNLFVFGRGSQLQPELSSYIHYIQQ
jgi:hypothetical protein